MSTGSEETSASEIIDAMHVMSNASNRLVASAQLHARAVGDPAIADEIRTCIRALVDDFTRLRALLSTLQSSRRR